MNNNNNKRESNILTIKNDIENSLESFNKNNTNLDSKYNEDLYSFSLEEEKKFIKDIKLLSDENINIIKNLKTILLFKEEHNNKEECLEELKNQFIDTLKNSIKYFYKGQCFYKERLTLKMFKQYRTIKPDLKDDEILKALQDSSPDQIFFKTSFGFNFSDSSKSALVYIQYRHHDLKTLNLTIKEIQSVSKELNINWDLSVEWSSFSINKYKNHSTNNNNNNNYNSNSPTVRSSISIGGNIYNNDETKKRKEEEEAKNRVFMLKKKLRATSTARRFLFFNIWCCDE
ncbi:hypothetical protein DICPUDRAFT_153945 [Dictyostelium purpureum]|uniref:Uncharacterized protein n=1 Tax=Dictyostelium purpureum TaxID=5786 RepID=F0ZQ53_DICPU|nr:uncharacterized protein DICPUDRAFT_153945 [Dictyostelium purpureum]EGC33925.1 hypothetical protein DICPUDRAFT_153945 [Dictyostelium purpureum]|eukprot:XP_003289560.1 hypothetical protein DICPUDRAFT_153945 [Dictyostelium purpureum]